ncbi:CDK-activating kinase assembly factor MAT1-like [Mytilus edulis]|uniref:CDK-activating kinase assembly factor MAT1-like n=1 Tax=Mytilus edulis TaxID=6550 RepID=UPI0039EF9805
MDDQGCPRCKTTKYRNPSLKLLVNICGHSLCESCVDLLFIKGSGACPECGTALRRSNFRLQLFEDPYIEKEVDIRKKILRDFNKKEDDFNSLNEYNDYLEMIETIVFNLANNIDVEETRKMIDQYKKENKEQISKGRAKMSKDEEYLEMLIGQEKQDSEIRRQIEEEDEKRHKNTKLKNKEALIDELMFSDMSAKDIIAIHKHDQEKEDIDIESSLPQQPATQFSTGIRLGAQNAFLPVPDEKIEIYKYSPIHVDLCGPELQEEEQLMSLGYMRNVRATSDSEKAGGFDTKFSCQRALQDAFCGLFYFPVAPQMDQS